MAAKRLKMVKQKRAAPRSLGVNWHNGAAVKAGHVDLSVEGVTWYEEQTRKPQAPSTQQLGITFNKLKHFTHMKTVMLKVDIYFTPAKDAFYLVCYNYQKKKVQVSMSYGSKDRVLSAWNTQTVKWKYKRNLL